MNPAIIVIVIIVICISLSVGVGVYMYLSADAAALNKKAAAALVEEEAEEAAAAIKKAAVKKAAEEAAAVQAKIEASMCRSGSGSCKELKNDNCFVGFQGDGNVVSYYKNGTPKASTKTHWGDQYGPYQFILQDDGNFKVIKKDGWFWSTDTNGKGVGPYKLELKDTCDLVLTDSTNKELWKAG
jgi:hypothetical protein